jgi:hypothetical protein
MKKIVYLLVVAGCLLQADSTDYTRIAWTRVPKSALQTDDFYNPSQVQQEEPVEIVQEIETPPASSTFYVSNEVTDNSSKQDSVDLATPVWIFVD